MSLFSRDFQRRGAARFVPAGLCALLLLLASPAALAKKGHSPGERWLGEIRPAVLRDMNPDPGVVEVQLVAKPETVSLGTGNKVEVWTYNGMLPGPAIEANVGDTLVVNFKNLLPEPTTVHWHGVEVPAAMDGSHIAQTPVPPGGEFRYEFKLLRAATYWYHPHIRSNEQVEKGLYGMLVVHDPREDRALGLPRTESWLVLDDIKLDDTGQVAEFDPVDPLENATQQVNGREGNTLLVNGRANARGLILKGVPHRLRIVNTSNTRFMRLSIPGHTMYRIGGDAGLIEAPIAIEPIEDVATSGLLLTPGERADVVFTPKTNVVELKWHDIARGRHMAQYGPDGNIVLGHMHHDGHHPPVTLLKLYAVGFGKKVAEYVPPSHLRDVAQLDADDPNPIQLEFGHTQPDADGDITFFVQRKANTGQCPPMMPKCPLPFAMVTPEDAPDVNVGDTRIIEVHNLTGGDHNFHLHGFMFQHLDTRYIDMDAGTDVKVDAERTENKDTILLPRRPGAMGRSKTITRLAVRFDDTGREGLVAASGKVPGPGTSGGWVFHCHLLEHADRGMMSFAEVFYP